MTRRAGEPFVFCSRLSLPLLTGVRAADLGELLGFLRNAPDPVVYHHTHRFLQQHQYLVPEPPNDFAYWATHMLQDDLLGERLAAIDTVRFTSLRELRDAFVSAIEERLRADGVRRVPPGKEFHFMSAVRFSLPTRHRAWDLREFGEGLKKVGISSLYLHIFEARLRPPLGVNDFSHWFKTELGEDALASRVAGLDPYTRTTEGLRSLLLALIDARLKEPPHAPS